MSEVREHNQENKIVGIGACVMDTLITVPHYPKEDTKLKAVEVRAAGGGPTATGLVAAARLGVESGYIGVLSDDNGGAFLKQDFQRYGVNISNVEIKSGYRSFTSAIWLAMDSATRTCVFDKGNLPAWSLTDDQKQAVMNARLLMIDGNEITAAEEAVRLAAENGVKVLYDAGGLYEGVERLLPWVDYLIPSEEFALQHTGAASVEDAARILYERYQPEVVIITCGKKGGILYSGNNCTPYPAFEVEAVDTNGAGDVFHGAFAAGIVKGYSALKCCYYASATSALKCTGIGARESVPDSESVIKFLEEKGYEFQKEV